MWVCGWVGHRANAKGKPRTALSTLLQQAAGLHIRDVLLNNDNDVAREAKKELEKKEESEERKGERVACPAGRRTALWLRVDRQTFSNAPTHNSCLSATPTPRTLLPLLPCPLSWQTKVHSKALHANAPLSKAALQDS